MSIRSQAANINKCMGRASFKKYLIFPTCFWVCPELEFGPRCMTKERVVHPILFLNFTHFPQVTNEQTYNHHLTLLCQHGASDKLRSVSFSNKIKPGDRIGRQTFPSQLGDPVQWRSTEDQQKGVTQLCSKEKLFFSDELDQKFWVFMNQTQSET